LIATQINADKRTQISTDKNEKYPLLTGGD